MTCPSAPSGNLPLKHLASLVESTRKDLLRSPLDRRSANADAGRGEQDRRRCRHHEIAEDDRYMMHVTHLELPPQEKQLVINTAGIIRLGEVLPGFESVPLNTSAKALDAETSIGAPRVKMVQGRLRVKRKTGVTAFQPHLHASHLPRHGQHDRTIFAADAFLFVRFGNSVGVFRVHDISSPSMSLPSSADLHQVRQ